MMDEFGEDIPYRGPSEAELEVLKLASRWKGMPPKEVITEIIFECLATEMVTKVKTGRTTPAMAQMIKIMAGMHNLEQGSLTDTNISLPESIPEALKVLKKLKQEGAVGSQQYQDLLSGLRTEIEYQHIPTVMELAEKVEAMQSKFEAKTDFSVELRRNKDDEK